MSEHDIHADLMDIHEKCVAKNFGTTEDLLPIIYHYTNSESAFSIIQNQQLRLTDIRFVNDPLEISNAISIGHPIVCTQLDKMDPTTPASKALVASWHYLLNAIRRYIEPTLLIEFEKRLVAFNAPIRMQLIEGVRKRQPRVFIAAFSSSNDDLTQWRAYANQGKGYNIGFDFNSSPFREEAQTSFGFAQKFCGIVKSNYASDIKKSAYFLDLIEQLVSYLHSIPEQDFFSQEAITEKDAFIVSALMNCYTYDVLACKSEHYQSENEWRLFQFTLDIDNDATEDGFYVKNDYFAPYKILNLSNEIRSVKIGPANLTPLAIDGAEYLLKNKKIQGYLVERSKIQYRS